MRVSLAWPRERCTLDANGVPTGLTTQTDATGTYTFSNLSPGDYQLHFDLATLPAGYKPTTADVGGDDATGSGCVFEVTAATPTTGFIHSNQQVTNLDMGVIGPVSVGSRAGLLDRNGIQDAGEPGVTAVAVAIFNADGTPAKDMNGNLVSSQLTNSSGHYSFTNLLPGSYYVKLTQPPCPPPIKSPDRIWVPMMPLIVMPA